MVYLCPYYQDNCQLIVEFSIVGVIRTFFIIHLETHPACSSLSTVIHLGPQNHTYYIKNRTSIVFYLLLLINVVYVVNIKKKRLDILKG